MTKTNNQKIRAQNKTRVPRSMPRPQRQVVIQQSAPKQKSKKVGFGEELGAVLGKGAQKIAKMMGFGEYKIESNSLLTGGLTPPEIVNTVKNEGFIVRHREYIADISNSSTFAVQTFDINPGLFGSFPYLAQVARSFELYRMRGLVYEFKSMSSDAVLSANASSSLGVIAMATQYNSLNTPFTNLIQMENHQYSSACKPSCDIFHPVECKRSLVPNTELYVRTGDLPVGGDLRWSDLGQFSIAVSGTQGTGVGILGQLWCSYEIELYVPKYEGPAGILSEHVFSGSCTDSNWMGTSHVFSPNNSLGVSVGPNSIIFPSNVRDGTYLILVKYLTTGAAAAAVAPLVSAPSSVNNFTLLQLWGNAGGPGALTNGNSATVLATTTFHLAYLVSIGQSSVTITFSGGTLTDSVCDLFITQFDSDIITA